MTKSKNETQKIWSVEKLELLHNPEFSSLRSALALKQSKKSWIATSPSAPRDDDNSGLCQNSTKTLNDFELVLKASSGTWAKEDALDYQNKIRSEWESRPGSRLEGRDDRK